MSQASVACAHDPGTCPGPAQAGSTAVNPKEKIAMSTTAVPSTETLEPADLISFDSLLSSDELALRAKVRSFVDEAIRPNIAGWYEAAHFPLEIVPEMGKLGLLGMHLHGYGCAGRSAV